MNAAKGVIHMKLICSKSNLQKGVNIVSKAVPSRTTMSILECILIDASTNEIKFTANDMELGIETRIEGEILEKGLFSSSHLRHSGPVALLSLLSSASQA